MRNAVTNPRDFAAFVGESQQTRAHPTAVERCRSLMPRCVTRAETVKDAVKYYGMWRARFETDESREEYHFIDKDDAARQLEQAGHIFRTQVVAARRRDLAEGPRELSGQFKSASLGMNFEEIMYLLQEQMWGADDSSKSAFECAIRYGMADGTRFEGMVAAFENSKEEYGYRCAVLGSVQGPSPYHVIDPKECVSLFRQLRETFEMELDELTRRDFEGENVDGENDGDSEISDMQDMMDTLAPLDSDALLAVNSKTDEKAAAVDLAARDSRLGSWGGKYLVSDLYAQATWLRDHAGQGSESNDHAEITCTVYFLWLCGGFLTGAHWIYLANKGRAHWGNWHEDRGTIPTVSGPPPPPEIICGITGKVMQDPYTLRTAAVQGVAASTTNQKLFSCNHTFEGEALFKALSVERKCPRCGMKPFTASYRQSGVKALMQKSPSVGHVVDTWYIIQNLAPPSAPPPPSNVWPCLWHALLCWILVSSSIASRHLAFSMSTGCDGGQAVLANNSTGGTQGAVECTWDKQPASVSGLYMCHVFLGLGVLVTWISDGLSGRHVALQVMHLEKLTVLCTTNWSATWLVIGNAGITFLLFAGWQIVMSTRMS